MPIIEAGIDAIMGYAVVFFGLVLLMAVVAVTGRIMAGKAETANAAAPAPAAAAPAGKPAPGSAGELKLHNVPDKDAAMVMAIVADQMGKPLNELRFKSIKEVK